MLSSFFEMGLRTAQPEYLTDGIFLALVLSFAYAVHFKRTGKHEAYTNYAPTLLTSLGIFGTFLGIVAGLLNFDTSDIDGSIGPLLEGMKTAFITSIAGLTLSIIYKLIESSVEKSADANQEHRKDAVDASDIYEIMSMSLAESKSINQSIQNSDKNNTDSITALRNQIQQIVDHSAQKEVQLNEFQKLLWDKLDSFAELMSKSATEQVVEALNGVIRDFNTKLTEQFGKNFEELNQAVYKLVEWQENYKNQLIEMQDKYALGVKAISETEASVSKITEHTQTIPQNINSLKSVLEVNQHQIAELDKHLDAFVQVRDAAVASVPEIKEKIDSAIEGVKQANELLAQGITTSTEKIEMVISQSAEQYMHSVDQTRAALTESAQTTANSSEEIKSQFTTALEDINGQLRDMVETLQAGNTEISTSIKTAGTSLIQDTADFTQYYNKELNQIRDQLANTVAEQTQTHRAEVEKLFGGLQQSMDQVVLKNNDNIVSSMNKIDESMGEEVERVIQQLGNNLGAVTEKFASDYTRLIRVMETVLNQHTKLSGSQ